MKETWYCAKCGSLDIRHDGILQWDTEGQDWKVLDVLNDTWCQACAGRAATFDDKGDPTFGQPPEFVVVVFIPTGPQAGEVLLQQPMESSDPMDARHWAQHVADAQERELSETDGHIPNCAGDIRVEFRRDPDNAVVIFSGESFYFAEAA